MNPQTSLVSVLVGAVSRAWAAEARERGAPGPRPRPSRLKVFLDCDACLQDSIRKEVDSVEYVRDRREADIHVLITSQPTLTGRREYAIAFDGTRRFEGIRAVAHVGVGYRTPKAAPLRSGNRGLYALTPIASEPGRFIQRARHRRVD